MKFENSKKIEVLKTDKASGFKLAETEFSEVVELELKPQGVIDAHALPINVVFYVISGNGEIIIDDELLSTQVGDVIEVKANKQRGWVNNSDKTLRLLAIKQKA